MKITATLPDNLTRYGFEYVLMMQDQSKALYSQYFEGKHIGYEVLMLQNEKQLFSYPRHEDFGVKAWAFRNEQEAIDFFHSLSPYWNGQMALPF